MPPPPTRYIDSLGYDNLVPHLAMGPAEQQGNQSQCQPDGYHALGISQYIPPAAGPPRLEQYVPAIPVLSDHPSSHVPLPHNIAGPSRGNPNTVHFGTPVAEDLKNLASDYLHNPGSHVNKLRVRRSRSGAVKVLILLEIDDTM
ncbi:hypothetical protein DFH94DRAFT_690645 [Russula ochroleuca]|uniref:Uncharacterized protein n=1 Tax=Russula ochroleuca TaxID=152965 RepID=A0A9P5MZ59_9AGAM|nr:hypothetical protein DFH94DRAFT_690645 [Russula ochroleuca]